MDEIEKLATEMGIVPYLPCDHPVCIGGECCYECERADKHRQFILECAKERDTGAR